MRLFPQLHVQCGDSLGAGDAELPTSMNSTLSRILLGYWVKPRDHLIPEPSAVPILERAKFNYRSPVVAYCTGLAIIALASFEKPLS